MAQARQPRICIVSFGQVNRVSRLSRLTAALRSAGMETWLIAGSVGPDDAGLASFGQTGGDVRIPLEVSRLARYSYRVIRIARGLAAYLPGPLWRAFDGGEPESRYIARALARGAFGTRSLPSDFDVVIAHGLHTMHIAETISKRGHAKIVYDVTELFTEQYSYSRLWRLVERKFVCRREAFHAHRANALISPSAGYLDFVIKLHSVDKPATTIRNSMTIRAATAASETALDPVQAPLNVLYQGLVLPNRGVGVYIDSANIWPARARLILQVLANSEAHQNINSLISDKSLERKVSIVPPANANDKDLVESVARYHAAVGLCCFNPTLHQLRLSEPNKFYTYLAAGAAIIAVRGTWVGEIVEKYGLGVTIADLTPEALADAVAELEADRALTVAAGRRALALAETWSWNNESVHFIAFIRALLEHAPAPASEGPDASPPPAAPTTQGRRQ